MREDLDDIAIIHMVLQGQQSAYATLVARYESFVFSIVLRFVSNREVAEELAQDVFVKAYRYLADFKGNSKFSTWLYTIVNTTCLSHIRKKKDETILLEEEKMITISDRNYGERPADVMEQRSQKQMLDSAIKQLPAQDAEILMLYYQSEQSVEEIGSIIGLSTSNVKVRLFRARQKLKEVLERRHSKMELGI